MLSLIFPTQKTDPELTPFRSGLVFGFFNALTWQVALGTPLVLFAQQLGASPLEVGLATSFVLLLTPIQILSTALLPRFGFKRVMLGGWSARSVFLIVPIALAAMVPWWGTRGWMAEALVGSVFFFCLCRSVGAAAFNPWIYAIVPATARGRYFANDQFVSAAGSVMTLLMSVALFRWCSTYAALLVLYVIALAGSTLSFFALRKLPDGPRPETVSVLEVARATPRHILTRGTFRTYLWIASGYYVLSTPIPAFVAYYLKVVPGLTMEQIMAFEVVRYIGVFLAAWGIRRRVDAAGAKPFLLLALGLYLAVATYWWLFLRNGFGGLGGILGAYLLLGIAVTCWTVANLNYLPKIVPEMDRPLMLSIHGAVTSCLGGCAPLVWGWFLKAGDATGPAIDVAVFGWFFVTVGAGAVVLAVFVARLPEDRSVHVESLSIGSAVLRPFRAVTYLVSLIQQPTDRAWTRKEKPRADREKKKE